MTMTTLNIAFHCSSVTWPPVSSLAFASVSIDSRGLGGSSTLPGSGCASTPALSSAILDRDMHWDCAMPYTIKSCGKNKPGDNRSEERRVGKESNAGWSGKDDKRIEKRK